MITNFLVPKLVMIVLLHIVLSLWFVGLSRIRFSLGAHGVLRSTSSVVIVITNSF